MAQERVTDRLIIAASETDADLYYASRFLAPDAFVFLETASESILLMSDLELGRARSQARVDTVLPLSRYQEAARKGGQENPGQLHALDQLLEERGIRALDVPRSFPLHAADFLREQGYSVSVSSGAFFPSREIKTAEEVNHIREVQRHAEAAMDAAVDAIRGADARDGVLHADGVPLTSEAIRLLISRTLLACECTARHTIVACGDQACDPHNEGSGPLCADQPIIIDIFPRSDQTGYFADITRTVVKGQPTDELQRIYDTVLESQQIALSAIRAGANGKTIHQQIVDLFESREYQTGEIDGRMQGYFHGTGHGLGLEIHEPPRIGKTDCTLEPGHVVTVEPGLYYPNRGAVRIEDLVIVTENGCENLTTYPKFLTIE